MNTMYGMTQEEFERNTIALINAMRAAQMKIAANMPQGFVLASTARLLGNMVGTIFSNNSQSDLSEALETLNEIVDETALASYNVIRQEAPYSPSKMVH